MNGSWHKEHPMPPHATLEQRVEWHRAHTIACGCRTPPKAIADILAARDAEGDPGEGAPTAK
jgi:hypothetical protein